MYKGEGGYGAMTRRGTARGDGMETDRQICEETTTREARAGRNQKEEEMPSPYGWNMGEERRSE
jgi:hypothetical protein